MKSLVATMRVPNPSRIYALFAALTLAACLVALAATTAEKAEAAFPGKNGKIAFTRCSTDNGYHCLNDTEIYAMNPDGSDPTQLTKNRVDEYDPTWSPDGRKLAFVRGADLFTMDPDGSNQTRLTDTSQKESMPAWSPDGRKLVFVRGYDLFTMSVSRPGDPPQRLIESSDLETLPDWSPDGRKIAFVRRITPYDTDIFVMKAAPESPDNRPRNLTGAPVLENEYDFYPDWSPNGQKIVFDSDRGGTLDREIYKMPADGSARPVRLTNTIGQAFMPVYSPNQAKIAYRTSNNKESEIFVMDYDGKSPVNLTRTTGQLNSAPDWQPLP